MPERRDHRGRVPRHSSCFFGLELIDLLTTGQRHTCNERFDALAACLRTQDYGHLLLYNPEPKEWTAETMSAVLKPLWAQALSLVYGDKKDAARKGSDVQLWIPEGLLGSHFKF